MRVLLFGGGFDPPHRGHVALLSAALEELAPERALVLPTWRSPTKREHGAPPPDRLAMARLLARGRERAAVDPFELERGRRTYAFELLRHARRRYPRAELWFLIGSDSLKTLPAWRRAEELRDAAWLVGRRPGAVARIPAGFRARILRSRLPDVASSEVRARLYAGRPWRALVPQAIRRYIERRGLYGLALRAELERTLSPKRYEHTLAVAALAAELARRYRHDPAAAALAGLLHDCGRRFDPAGLARYARRRRLPVPARRETLSRAPLLAHAYVSADLARRRFGVRDPAVLRAIAHHTLGRPGMGAFERLLYVADSASEDRGFPAAAHIRTLAARDLDAAFREAVRVKARTVRDDGDWLHPGTRRLLAFAESLR